MDKDSKMRSKTQHPQMEAINLNRVYPGLRWGLQVLMVALLLLVALRAEYALTWGGVIGFVVIYLARPWLRRWVGHRAWFGLLIIAWVVMAIAQVEGAFVVFPLFFLAVFFFPPLESALVVGALTLGVVAILIGHVGFNVGAVVGPAIAAAVAWTLGVGLQLLHREAKAKSEALDALVAAREEALASSRQAGEADERMRLAGDIHDTVAQGLSSIHMLLTAVEAALHSTHGAGENPGEEQKQVFEQVRLAKATAAENLSETRRIIAALQPAPLANAGLPVALARMASSTPLGKALSFELDGQVRTLPSEVEEGLLRCAQSLVSNVVRHAHASRAKLTLTFHPGDVILDVVDNGRGFDSSQAVATGDKKGSLGLSGVYRRVEAMGGRMVLESTPGAGTGVSITVPTTQERPEP